ncbi:MAG: hypothetical protein Kow0069_32340 [Promethearchaeota archaeon]
MHEIHAIRHPDVDLELDPLVRATCVVGMPGIADVGKFAVDQLIGLLHAKRFVDLVFSDYPAGAIVEESLLSTPKAEVLVWRDPKNERDLVFVTADAQAMTPGGVYSISNYLAALIAQVGVVEVIALGAFPVQKNAQRRKEPFFDGPGSAPATNGGLVNDVGGVWNVTPRVFVTATEPTTVDHFVNELSCRRISKGVIVGANGLIPTLTKARFGVSGVVLLAETDTVALVNEDVTDLAASVELIKVLALYLDLPLKEKYSPEKVSEMSRSLEDKRKKLEQEIESFTAVRDESAGAERSLYI